MPFDLRTLIDSVAAAAGHLGQETPEGRSEIWQKTQAFALSLLNASTRRWIPFYTERRPCHVHMMRSGVPFPCNSNAILFCDACGKPACIEHAQVDASGHGTCAACLVELIRLKRGPGAGAPPPVDRTQEIERLIAEALKTLGLKPGAMWPAINEAHRRLAAQHHPDRVKSAKAKERATARASAVNAAHATLKQHYRVKGVA